MLGDKEERKPEAKASQMALLARFGGRWIIHLNGLMLLLLFIMLLLLSWSVRKLEHLGGACVWLALLATDPEPLAESELVH